MGLFLALSGVIGKTEQEIAPVLQQYAKKEGGDLQPFKLDRDHDNCCLMQTENGNCTVLYPDPFLGWDDASGYLSQELKAPVFSLHIHDGDF
ncbi:MAG: hypothetical protein JST39_18150, partial [Bacteroidetes bacterium]|nr:hypothetical protein [Bacteroidota bacterium]